MKTAMEELIDQIYMTVVTWDVSQRAPRRTCSMIDAALRSATLTDPGQAHSVGVGEYEGGEDELSNPLKIFRLTAPY